MFRLQKYFILIAVALCCWKTPVGLSQQLRCETDVYFEGSKKPDFHHIVLFDRSRIYDIAYKNPPGTSIDENYIEAVIFDRKKFTITTLDPKRKIKIQITNEGISNLVNGMKLDKVLSQRDPFVLNPSFEESVDQDSKTIRLTSPRISYLCKGKKEKKLDVLASYFYYVRWSARLIVTNPKSLVPPFSRFKLNAALEKQGWLPTEVNFQFLSLGGKKFSATAKHHYTKILSEIDKKRIQSIESHIKEFRKTDLKEFRKLETPPSK